MLNGFFFPAIDQLELTNASTLTIPESSDLILTSRSAGPAGMLNSDGTVFLTGGDLLFNSDLQIDGLVTFTGGGVVDMSDASNNRILGNNAFNTSSTLIIEDYTIEGAGQLGYESLSIRNNSGGVIRANRVNNALVVAPGANNNVVNAGLMEATNGGILRIKQTAVNNNGGTIRANNGSLVLLHDVTVSSGELAGTGVVRGISTVTLEGPITNSSNYAVAVNTSTILDGDLTNSGLVTIAGGNFLIDGTNAPGGQVAIDGGGAITLSVTGISRLSDVFGTVPTLTNVDNTINGAGNIGNNSMGLINQGTIRADEATAPLVLWLNNMINQSTAEAVGGATLDVRVAMDNTSGQVNATGSTVLISTGGSIDGGAVNIDSSGRLELSNGFVTGGTVSNTAGGVIATNQFITNRLSGQVNNPGGGVIEIADDTGLIFDEAGNYQNAGVIKLNGSGPFADFAATRLMLDGQVTLSGGGEVLMSNAADNAIFSAADGDDTLINEDHLIHGSGHIGRNGTAIVNRAVISADQPFTGAAETGTLSIDPNAGRFINEGMLKAFNGGTLQLLNGDYQNATGVIQAQGGSTVDIAQGVNIRGGRLASSGSGQFRITGSTVTFDGIGIELDGQFQVESIGNLRLLGDVTNRGELGLANGARLFIDGPVTLDGGGVVHLSGTNSLITNFPGSVDGDMLINEDNTITGLGTIRFVDVINGGTVAPGNSPGTLTIQANYTQTDSSTLAIELAGRNPGEFDVLNVNGIATLDGLLQVLLLPGFEANAGDAFDILQAGTVIDNFFLHDIPKNDAGSPLFNVVYNPQSMQLVANEDIRVVPEPSTLILVAIGPLTILLISKRRIRSC